MLIIYLVIIASFMLYKTGDHKKYSSLIAMFKYYNKFQDKFFMSNSG